MFKGRSILLLCIAALLTACQGNSGSGSTNTGLNSPPPGTICPTGSTLTLSGVKVDVDRFDVNNSGCLEPGELDDVNDYVSGEIAYSISLLKKEVTGTNNTSGLSSVISMYLMIKATAVRPIPSQNTVMLSRSRRSQATSRLHWLAITTMISVSAVPIFLSTIPTIRSPVCTPVS